MGAIAAGFDCGLFVTDLCLREVGEKAGRSVYALVQPLIYVARSGDRVVVPEGFQTDLASVPRVPVVWLLWGDRAHREAVLHDYLYRTDAVPTVGFMGANRLFLEAMKARGVPRYIRWPMFLGVVLGGIFSYHKLPVSHRFFFADDLIV
ncbi:MAG: hypothetical protein A4E73_02427 [Syntrophaceae bacterium PtaU1.Bin231]|nr:MAG: hypothetical protein A4E73_02427 [Syntrophaceae bacterium PtaU1.Bin231]